MLPSYRKYMFIVIWIFKCVIYFGSFSIFVLCWIKWFLFVTYACPKLYLKCVLLNLPLCFIDLQIKRNYSWGTTSWEPKLHLDFISSNLRLSCCWKWTKTLVVLGEGVVLCLVYGNDVKFADRQNFIVFKDCHSNIFYPHVLI